MKNLTLISLFFLAALGVGTSLDAGAESRIVLEPGALTRPVPLPLEARDGGEEDEEDLRVASEQPSSTTLALEEVDPGALVEMMRLRMMLAGLSSR